MAEIRAIPQSPALGKIAAALRKAQEFAGQYQVLPQVPLLGGTGVDELLGLPGAAREVENWSYGNYPVRINPNAGRTASYIPEIKPGRGSDLADTLLLGLDVAPLASLAAKGVVRAARSAPAQAIDRAVREGYERGVIPAPGMTIKPKGGNWMAGTIDDSTRQFRQTPEWLSGETINEAAGENLWAKMVQEGGHHDPHGWLRANRPDVYDKMVGPEGTAINRWLETKLNKYIRNEMGTPDDPVKALAERGVLHFQPQGIRDQSPIMDKLRMTRQIEGFPAEGTATTPLGQQWERYSDYAIEPRKAGNIQSQAERGAFTVDRENAQRAIEENPWIAKLDPEAKVYSARWSSFDEEGLGFPHLIDELKNAMDPNSTLPRNLRLDPKDIDKITVPQAVERVAKINAWRAEQAAQAEKAGMLENLKATPRLADDSFQLSFVKKPGGAWVDIPETVDEKGMKLCTSIGKAGGWCTQADWAATSYGSGHNRLTALVDTEGRPHAQAKITAPPLPRWETVKPYLSAAEEEAKLLPRGYTDEDVSEIAARMAREAAPKDITELKPVGNSFSSERAQEYAKRDPDYFRKVENSVLKFLNNGNWGKVADLHHYGIVDLKNPDSLVDAMKTLYGDESSRRVGQEFVDAFNMAVDAQPDAPRFMTQRQLREFIGPVEPLEGYAGGGIVKGAVKSIGELVQKYIAKEAPEAAVTAAPKEQKMLQGFYRGYAGEPDVAGSVFVTPQRAVGEYYANKRAAQTGAEPHLEMILADPFAGRGYGHSTMGTGKNPPMITRARELAPEDVKDRTKLYAAGGAVADTNVRSWLAANPGATDVDIAAAMQRYNIAPEQVSRATNVGTPEVEQRYAAAVAPNALVTQAYRDILQRDPEQEGLQYWTNQLSTNQLTPESLYQNIAAAAQGADAPNAQRYANALQNRNLVTQAYQDILQRAPEQEGLSYWTGQLNTGALTPETLRQNILASAQGADAAKAQQYAQNFAATQPDRPKHGDVAPKNAADPSSVSNPYSTRKTLDDLASIYSIGRYFIPGMQLAAPIDYALRGLSLANTIKNIGKKLGFAAGGPVNYDPTEIDTIVSRVKEELHG